MRFKNFILFSLLIIVSFIFVGCSDDKSEASKDEPIIFGDEGWDSIRFHNEIAGIILEEGYGYKTEQLSGSDAALWKGFERGDIDIHMEAWTEDIREMYEQALDSGKVVELSVNFDDNFQGLYVPTYVIEGDEERGIDPVAPNLKYIEDLEQYSDVFTDPDDPEKGRIVGASPGWTIDEMLEDTIIKYDLDNFYNYVSPGSESSINADLIKAYKAGEPWVGYNYEPNWIMNKYDMTPLLEKDPEGLIAQVASQDITIAAHVDLIERAPEIEDFLKNYETSSDIASEALTYIQDEDASTYEAAVNFLKNYEELWTEWVPEDIVEKVKNAL